MYDYETLSNNRLIRDLCGGPEWEEGEVVCVDCLSFLLYAMYVFTFQIHSGAALGIPVLSLAQLDSCVGLV